MFKYVDATERKRMNEVCIPENLAENTDDNVKQYLNHYQTHVVGTQFKGYMRLCFEKKVIEAVMKSDYKYDGPTLTTFKDVQEVLFSDKNEGDAQERREG